MTSFPPVDLPRISYRAEPRGLRETFDGQAYYLESCCMCECAPLKRRCRQLGGSCHQADVHVQPMLMILLMPKSCMTGMTNNIEHMLCRAIHNGCGSQVGMPRNAMQHSSYSSANDLSKTAFRRKRLLKRTEGRVSGTEFSFSEMDMCAVREGPLLKLQGTTICNLVAAQ